MRPRARKRIPQPDLAFARVYEATVLNLLRRAHGLRFLAIPGLGGIGRTVRTPGAPAAADPLCLDEDYNLEW